MWKTGGPKIWFSIIFSLVSTQIRVPRRHWLSQYSTRTLSCSPFSCNYHAVNKISCASSFPTHPMAKTVLFHFSHCRMFLISVCGQHNFFKEILTYKCLSPFSHARRSVHHRNPRKLITVINFDSPLPRLLSSNVKTNKRLNIIRTRDNVDRVS